MLVIKLLRQILVKFDLFPATQFLRYKGQLSYRTATGGIFTILTIIIFFIIFANALVDILNKKTVTLSTDIQQQSIPEATNITFGPKGGFMLAISIRGINLSRTDLKYFDITLSLNQFVPITQLINSTTIPLEMCTANHFNFNAELAKGYTSLDGSNLLCPQLNSVAEISGKVSSDIFKRLTVTIKKCNASLTSICANDSQVQQIQNSLDYFGLGIVLVNTELNPSLSNSYKEFYLDDKHFFPFTTSLAIRAKTYIEQYKIQTDQSIYPLSDIIIEKGVRIPDYFQYTVIPVTSDTYAVVHLQKSSTFSSYSRSFRKLDTLFSYVGGLIGTILGVIFILNSYNELCYQISLGSRLCKYDDEENIKAQRFNIIYYFGYLLYKFVKRFFCCKYMGMMHIFTECHQEIQKQLDVRLLMRKLIFFERFISQASTKLNIDPLLLTSKGTLYELKHYREKYQESLLDDDDDYQDTQQKQGSNKDQSSQQNNSKKNHNSQMLTYSNKPPQLKNDLLNKQHIYTTQLGIPKANPGIINSKGYYQQVIIDNPLPINNK